MPRHKRSVFKNIVSEIALISSRIKLAFILIILLLMLVIIRLLVLTSFEHTYYLQQLQNNAIRLLPIAPRRGLIFDRHGVLLAENKPVYSLDIQPDKSKNITQLIAQLQKLINITDEQIKTFHKQLKFHHRSDKIPLVLALNKHQQAIIAVNQYRLPGVSITARFIRYYPHAKAFASVLGYVGRINSKELANMNIDNYRATQFIGKNGVELYFEKQLHGTVGYQKILVNAMGHPVKTLGIIKPISGKNLYLTLDSKVQLAAYRAFAKDNGSAVAINPNNGNVIALVSHPGFNANLFVMGISTKKYQSLLHDPNQPLFNRALRGLYPMASTIKPFLALGALDDNLIDADLTIDDPGYFKLKNSTHIFHDWKHGGHGIIDLARAITVSCDTFFYNLANIVGINKIDKILQPYGIGQAPQINLPYALSGTLPSRAWKMKHIGKPWYIGDTIISGIGQGYFQVSPLQLANATAALANGNTLYRPNVLLKMENQTKTEKQAAAVINQLAPENLAARNLVIHAMQQVINSSDGTGYRFGRNAPFTAAGKTGTAQVISLHKFNQYRVVPKNLRNHSLFIVFSPIEHPQIAVAVIAEHSKQAPAIARKIIDAYYAEETHEHPPA